MTELQRLDVLVATSDAVWIAPDAAERLAKELVEMRVRVVARPGATVGEATLEHWRAAIGVGIKYKGKTVRVVDLDTRYIWTQPGKRG